MLEVPVNSTTSNLVLGTLGFANADIPTAVAAISGLLVLALIYVLPSFFTKDSTAIYQLGGIPVVNAWTFFTKRYDFLQNNFKKSGEKLFKFKVLNHTVVAISGDSARKLFYNERRLNFAEGYKILMGGVPSVEDIPETDYVKEGEVTWFNKRLALLLKRERLEQVIPILFEDVHRRMAGWGSEGKINPFENVYDLVFQMTVRMASCRELADDLPQVARLHHLYWTVEQSSTPAALLLPWFPSPAKKAKEKATREMYELLNDYIEMRRKEGATGADAIDLLIKDGNQNASIIEFLMGVIFAGVINTGMSACWLLLHLAANPEWRERVASEVRSLIEKHADPATASLPLSQRLSKIPIPAWEDSLPILDACIRETLRLTTASGTALRRNVEGDLQVAGKVIDKGAFIAYNLTDVHMDPEVYEAPEKFDPARFGPGREEDRRKEVAFVGWGAGRHPCTGMRVAKLEIKMIIAIFLAGYEYELVNDHGKFPSPFPRPDPNDIQKARPLGDVCYLKFKRTVE